MWCPKCKNEYRPGFTHCPDCDVDLVESLDDLPVPVIFGPQEHLQEIAVYLKDNGIFDPSITLDEDEGVYELFVKPEDLDSSKQLVAAFLQQKAAEEEEDGQEDEEDVEEPDFAYEGLGDEREEDVRAKTFESKKQKAEEYKSPGYALIPVGILGLVLDVLLFLGKLPIHLSGSGKYLICGVMAAMFVLFIAMGISAMKSYKTQLALSADEESLIEEAESFLKDELSAADVDAMAKERVEGADLSALTKEQAYFPRMEVIRLKLRERFPDMEEALLDKLADESYTRLYDEEA